MFPDDNQKEKWSGQELVIRWVYCEWLVDFPEDGDVNLQIGSEERLICQHLLKMGNHTFCDRLNSNS